MLLDKLHDLQEKDTFQFYGIKHLDSLIEALNDWPGNPLTFDEYLKQLYKFFNAKTISVAVVRDATKNLNPRMQAWEMESFTSLYRFMYMNSSQNLEDLFEKLKKHLTDD